VAAAPTCLARPLADEGRIMRKRATAPILAPDGLGIFGCCGWPSQPSDVLESSVRSVRPAQSSSLKVAATLRAGALFCIWK
jgi:hypothetical protein